MCGCVSVAAAAAAIDVPGRFRPAATEDGGKCEAVGGAQRQVRRGGARVYEDRVCLGRGPRRREDFRLLMRSACLSLCVSFAMRTAITAAQYLAQGRDSVRHGSRRSHGGGAETAEDEQASRGGAAIEEEAAVVETTRGLRRQASVGSRHSTTKRTRTKTKLARDLVTDKRRAMFHRADTTATTEQVSEQALPSVVSVVWTTGVAYLCRHACPWTLSN
jgi:hypothetical protein